MLMRNPTTVRTLGLIPTAAKKSTIFFHRNVPPCPIRCVTMRFAQARRGADEVAGTAGFRTATFARDKSDLCYAGVSNAILRGEVYQILMRFVPNFGRRRWYTCASWCYAGSETIIIACVLSYT